VDVVEGYLRLDLDTSGETIPCLCRKVDERVFAVAARGART
jgi:hypothetical protein